MLDLARSFSLLMQAVTLIHQSFNSWTNPREVALCFCHFGWNKLINRLLDGICDNGPVILNRPFFGTRCEIVIAEGRQVGTKAFCLVLANT